jgi:predicted aspartyl protease
MLKLGEESFTTGRARFRDQSASNTELTAKIFVEVKFVGLDTTLLAQVDTGAAYSTLETEVADALGLLDGEGYPTVLSTRLGPVQGKLMKSVSLTLVAHEGVPLDLEATFFVSRDWRGPTFLGYTGLLDHIRIALDPPTNLFYFGASG